MLPLVSHVEYALLALLRLEKKTGQTDDGQMEWTDGWTLDRYIALTALCGERSPFFAILFFSDYRSNI